MRYITIVLATFIFMFFLSSCNKEEVDLQDETQGTDIPEGYAEMYDMAKDLSLELTNNPELLMNLKNQTTAMQKIGYYEQELFLGVETSIESLKRMESFDINTFLSKNYGDTYSKVVGKFRLPAILLIDEEFSNFNNRIYIDNGFDDRDENAVIPYYENGELYYENIMEKGTGFSFVIRESEGELSEDELINADRDSYISFINSRGENIAISTNNIKNYRDQKSNTRTYDRDMVYGKESLYKFRTRDDYDGRFKGHGEWYFVFIHADDVSYTFDSNGEVVIVGNPFSSLKSGVYRGIDDDFSWNYPWFSSIYWNLNNDGNRYKVIVMEQDNGSFSIESTSLTAGFELFGIQLSGTVNWSYEDRDDNIGNYFVYYPEDIGPNGYVYTNVPKAEIYHNERTW